MEKLKMRSPDIMQENIAKLAELFPNCVTEEQDEDGKLKRAIDFDQLRQELSDHVVDGPRERYHLNWPGKRESLLAANAPIAKTLRPSPEESVDFDTTKNLFIEGDNLDALKLLQETYLNKVKVIYIDPPYNTGKEFIYDDDFSEDIESFLQKSNQKDANGNRMVANPESNGRFHSSWLSMMYPRIKLSRNLLQDDGVLFVSIDDHEHARMIHLCDEIFGEDNRIANLVWKRKAGGGDDSAHVAAEHEYIVCYARDSAQANLGKIKHESASMTAKYNRIENGRRYYLERLDKTSLTYNASMDFEISCPDGTYIRPPQPDPDNPSTAWRWGRKTVEDRRDELEFLRDKKTGEWRVYTRTWEQLNGVTPRSLLVEKEHGRNRDGTRELANLLGSKVFTNPKPTKMLLHLLAISGLSGDDIALDFFAGSASFAHAVMIANTANGTNCRHISVQISEQTGRSDYPTIAHIAKERLRRAAKQIREVAGLHDKSLDVGFRVLKVDTSNMKDVYYKPDMLAKADLFEHIVNIKEDRAAEDLLFQVLLDWGVDLSLPIAQENIDGKTIFFVDDNALAACFDTGVTEALVKKLATRKPLRVVFRDAGFSDDSVKINVEQIFKLMSPDTEVKAI